MFSLRSAIAREPPVVVCPTEETEGREAAVDAVAVGATVDEAAPGWPRLATRQCQPGMNAIPSLPMTDNAD